MEKIENKFNSETHSYQDDLFYQEGIMEYIEDLCWKNEPKTCPSEFSKKIEDILTKFPYQQTHLDKALEYEINHGKGSYRSYVEKGLESLDFHSLADELFGPER
ncbi:hypothetical protein AWW67_13310 [Roseivirga seohaensis]|jgi:hypothetical protein|uniref:Uncharacterized protein n=1 Tax=Roseivirga seohaensis TaxID=1914963 RepID=A0A150XKT3_9BACT|nr:MULTISPECIES: hypothetical protein [Roseivirga]KYG79347.1 hypothetical protein AWW67_13310 [Roseivirga seohaensis]MBO6495510.1 hypothetical protein [Roseivirga sp.]